MLNLGNMISNGDGIPCDKKMACSLFKKAADLGYVLEKEQVLKSIMMKQINTSKWQLIKEKFKQC